MKGIKNPEEELSSSRNRSSGTRKAACKQITTDPIIVAEISTDPTFVRKMMTTEKSDMRAKSSRSLKERPNAEKGPDLMRYM